MKKSRLIISAVLLVGVLAALKTTLGEANKKNSVPAREPVSENPAPAAKTELLSSHMTIATFDGIKKHVCKGMTALCPDQCGDSGQLASFTINRYVKYEKPGEYGDPKQTGFQVMVENTLGKSELTPENRQLVESLKPGDKVLLCWNHNYVTENQSSFPERPVTVLKKLTPEEAARE